MPVNVSISMYFNVSVFQCPLPGGRHKRMVTYCYGTYCFALYNHIHYIKAQGYWSGGIPKLCSTKDRKAFLITIRNGSWPSKKAILQKEEKISFFYNEQVSCEPVKLLNVLLNQSLEPPFAEIKINLEIEWKVAQLNDVTL